MEICIYNHIIIKINEVLHKYRKTDSKCIVLVAFLIKPRIVKIGYALRKKGYKVILFLEENNKKGLYNSKVRFFDRVSLFKSKEEVYCKCLMLNPLVYHLFTEASVNEWAEYIVDRKQKIGKIVYDQYDVYKGICRIHNRNWEKREKKCFENADGICCRSFQTQYLKHYMGYRFKGKRILFLDYCWDKYHFVNDKKDNENLQIVYGGRILSPNSKDTLSLVEWETVCYIAKKFKKHKAYFMIIPTKSATEYPEFLKLKRDNQYLKIEEPMNFDELIRYESKMDYGIDCFEFQCKMDEYEIMFKGIADYRADAKYYATNKFFDYLDAGIPIIYGRKGELFGRYLSHFGVAAACAVEDMPYMLDELKRKRGEYTENVKRARKALAIENQIGRLIDFYKSL